MAWAERGRLAPRPMWVRGRGSVRAALAVAFSTYLSEIVPLSHLGAQLVGLAMIALITVINVLGTRKSADVQNWTTLVKMVAIVVMSGVLLAYGRGYSASRAALWPVH